MNLNNLRNRAITATVTVLEKAKAKPRPPIFEEIDTLLANPDIDLQTKLAVLNKFASLVKEAENA